MLSSGPEAAPQRSGACPPAFTPPTAISPGVSGTQGPARGSLSCNNQCHKTGRCQDHSNTHHQGPRHLQGPLTALLLTPRGKQTVSAQMPLAERAVCTVVATSGGVGTNPWLNSKPSANYARPTPGPHPPSGGRLGSLGRRLRHSSCETPPILSASLACASGTRKQILLQLHSFLDLVPSVLV